MKDDLDIFPVVLLICSKQFSKLTLSPFFRSAQFGGCWA